jgi:hypothetical protein
MKLAEALLLRADTKKKLASLRERLALNVVVQEKDKPHEDPTKLIKEATAVLESLEDLSLRVNSANHNSRLSDGRTLAELIARRDRIAQQHSLLHVAIGGTRKEPDRYSMKEIKWVATVDVPKLQKQSDDLSKQLRELNARIQETNWKIEID